jgi:hypothetical protein
LSRDEEAKHRAARKRLEERLWLWHDADATDFWETVEVPMRDKHGKILCDADGKPIMRKVDRPKTFDQLTIEQRKCIESISVTNSGKIYFKIYSAAEANEQLRRLHNIGLTQRGDDDVRRLSDTELVAQLAEQAEELGIHIDLSYRLRRDQ